MKTFLRSCIVAAAALWAIAAQALVGEAAPGHLAVKYSIKVKAPPDKAYAALIDVAHWWDPEHTYSGSAANLSLEPHAGGCWCEKLAAGGSVQHMSVLLAMPGKMLRLSGGLGPLQSGAVNGAMTWSFKPIDGGSEIALNYLVDGFFPGGLDKVAAGVDEVLNQQVQRLQRLIETGDAKATATGK